MGALAGVPGAARDPVPAREAPADLAAREVTRSPSVVSVASSAADRAVPVAVVPVALAGRVEWGRAVPAGWVRAVPGAPAYPT